MVKTLIRTYCKMGPCTEKEPVHQHEYRKLKGGGTEVGWDAVGGASRVWKGGRARRGGGSAREGKIAFFFFFHRMKGVGGVQ